MPSRQAVATIVACAGVLLGMGLGSAHAAETYTVRQGDTLWGIASRYGFTVDFLARTNGLSVTSLLHPGQRLEIPGPVAPGSRGAPGSLPRRGASGGPQRILSASVRTLLPSRGVAFTMAVVRTALRFLGRPYQWAGIGNRGFDCSGLVYRVFRILGLGLPHSSSAQWRVGWAVPPGALAPGDLVFFRTYTSGPSHVGIYLGGSRFIHASYSRGVVISSLDEPYYRARYLGARRP